MELLIGIFSLILIITAIILIIINKPKGNNLIESKIDGFEKSISKIELAVKEEIRINRNETSKSNSDSRQELNNSLSNFQKNILETLSGISKSQNEQLKFITENNQTEISKLAKVIEEKVDALLRKNDENNRLLRDELGSNLKQFNEQLKEKFSEMVVKQSELISSTEIKLEKMRETVDEKLQKTLEARLGQSFELVSKQLESVQKGLGEMQTLAQDVGGLKKVLGNVKNRGGIGEIQLEMLLEQILAPDQYEANVKTKSGSSDHVEFAIKLPGRDDGNTTVYLPIDAKFPKETYENLIEAYENADTVRIDEASKNIESVIKKMAKDIHDKYIDPPNTTDFGIMFLPFESIYAEVVRRASLLEQLQREYKIVVTGPTTLAAILNSLQMGFKTLVIQRRSSEVWNILKAIKTEFAEFGKVLTNAQEKINKANEEIDKLVGVRTRQINRKLKEVEILNPIVAKQIIDDENQEI